MQSVFNGGKQPFNQQSYFYNFGDAGQNKEDNIVAEYQYENIVIPQIIYLDNTTAVAFGDNGYSIFKE